LKWKEQDLYGSSRLGIAKPEREVTGFFWASAAYTLVAGAKSYELSNHLGNVMAVISDRGELQSAQDFFPFGMAMPGRSNGSYRYTFNGKETDPETGLNDFGARLYDSRLGRWLAIDPLAKKMPEQSPYLYCLNTPLLLMDPDGAYPIVTITKIVVGKAQQKVLGYTGTKLQYTTVDLYKVTVTDTEDKTFKLQFAVTRDAFAVRKNDVQGDEMTLTNVAFEPKDAKINHYTAKVMPGGYPKGDETIALKLQQYDSEVMHAEANDASLELKYRTVKDVAKGIMMHVAGVYQHKDGSTSCAASEGCFGVTDGKSSPTNPSNAHSNDVLGKIKDQAAKSKTRKGHIEVVIEKRNKNERTLSKKQKKS
jgi:RHS repeat-associated protein